MSEFQAAIIEHLEVWTCWFFIAYLAKDQASKITIRKTNPASNRKKEDYE